MNIDASQLVRAQTVLEEVWGDEWTQLPDIYKAAALLDFVQADERQHLTPMEWGFEYRDRIYRGNLLAYARTVYPAQYELRRL